MCESSPDRWGRQRLAGPNFSQTLMLAAKQLLYGYLWLRIDTARRPMHPFAQLRHVCTIGSLGLSMAFN